MKIDIRWLGAVALGALALGTSAAAQAAGAPADAASADGGGTAGIADIIVTAERHSSDVQHSALAITAISGNDLAQGGVTGARDLANQVPGLGVSNAAPLQNVFIRGVGGGQTNSFGDPAVSYNVDGVYIQRPFGGPSGTYYDLDRVEVLKGPQGTLYGRNATVGAINVLTKAPTFDFGGEVGAEIGNYSDIQTNGALNIPLSNTVATRFAFKTNRHDGYLSNGYNDAKSISGRASILFKPEDGRLTLRVTADYLHDTPRGPQGIFIYQLSDSQKYTVPGNPWFGFQASPCAVAVQCPTIPSTYLANPYSISGNDGFVDSKIYSLKTELNYDLGPATLTVLPAFVHTDVAFRSYTGGYVSNASLLSRQYSLETRLASNGNGPLKWVIGGYLYDEKARAYTDFSQPQGFVVFNVPHQKDSSYAAFGQATYSITSALRFTGGLRYTHEKKSVDGYSLIPNVPAPACTNGGTLEPGPEIPLRCRLANNGRVSEGDVTWKAGVEFDASAHNLLYANVSTGFKVGGIIPGTAPNTYRPEHLTSYQIGSKNRFFDNKLQINLEAFYWDYKDQQVYTTANINPAGFASYPVNEDGWLRGVEAEIVVAPTRHDRISTNVTFQQGKYTHYTNPGASLFIPPATTIVVVPASTLTDVNRPAMPHWVGAASYQHTFDLENGGNVVFGANTHFESGAWFDLTHRKNSYRDAYAMFDARLTYNAPEDRWSLGAFVNNIANKAVLYGNTSLIYQKALAYAPPNPNAWAVSIYSPRTYGVRMNVRF